ncbi:MAG: hypothetical protein E6I87_05360 [Chloroflexi bacterium]|nr:MAG: hypothetical protein E6I87_05360 [Chloroflexota bacterium]
MDETRIAAILQDCERELGERGRVDLKARHFWSAVDSVKRRPELIERYAARIAAIDRQAFLSATPLVFPAGVGRALLVAGTIVGIMLLGAAFALPADPLGGVAFLLGAGALLGATHGLAHLIVGRLSGIQFTHWYSRFPKQPQPGFKVDYASYLRARPTARAWMHASGAIVTKLIPFVLVPVAAAARLPWWTFAILLAIGILQLVTDALFSVRFGDWKKFRRERRIARGELLRS